MPTSQHKNNLFTQQKQETCNLDATPRPGHVADNCKMVYCLSELLLFTKPEGVVRLGFERHAGMIGVLCFERIVWI